MKTRLLRLILAALVVCDLSVFTSCTKDTNDNPVPENVKNRKEFIKHTRANLKDLAENLNFTSWEVANKINQEFNTTVLNNPEFEKAITPLFIQKVRETIKPVEEGSELAAMGYKMYATIDLMEFNYRFTMKADGSGFDVEEADDFEMIVNGFNPKTQQEEIGVRKLTLKSSGETYKQLARRLGNEELAVVILVPSDFTFSIASMTPGNWFEIFKGAFKSNIKLAGESEYMNPKTDVITITGVVSSLFPEIKEKVNVTDATDLYFSVGSDPVANKSNMSFSFGHNGKKRIELEAVASYPEKPTDYSQFTASSRIIDVLVALVSGGSLEGTITLNDDLTTDFTISDCGKVMQLQHEMAHARRNYADQTTIEEYTKQLNDLVNARITCTGVNQVIPMKLQTEKFGVDYWAMPAFKFADEEGYVPLTQLLDPESIQYGINIIDHAAEPMAGAIITVRQLLQFVQTFIMQMRVNQAQGQADNE